MRQRARARLSAALLISVFVGGLPLTAANAGPGPYSGGPTDFYEATDGAEIALTVVLPPGYTEGRRYPTILEMAGYENGSASRPTAGR